MACEDRELLETFIEEAKEYLEVLNSGLLALETSGTDRSTDKSLIHSIFRAAHSLKGNAALIGLDEIKTLSHSLESVFDAIREGTVKYSEKMYDTLFNTVDKLSSMIEQVINGESLTKDYSHLITRLDNFTNPAFSGEDDLEIEDEKSSLNDVNDDTDEPDPEIILAFCDDTKEIISSIGEDLFSLKKNPENEELIDSIFNRLHSLSGGASFLSLNSVCEVSCSLEKLLSLLKTNPRYIADKDLPFLSYLFEGVKLLGQMLSSLTSEKPESPESHRFLKEIEEFRKELDAEAKTADTPELRNKKPENRALTPEVPASAKSSKVTHDSIRVSSKKLDDTIKLMGEMISNFTVSRHRFALLNEAEKLSKKNIRHLTSLISDSHPQRHMSFSPAKGLMGILAIEEKLLDPAQVVNILHAQKRTDLRFGEAAVSLGYMNDDDVKKLMELQKFHRPVHGAVEELKEIKNRVKEVIRTAELLGQTVNKIVRSEKDEHIIQEVLTNNLKENALKMRMLPLSTIFNTFSRFVRDTGKMVNKSVAIEITGGETELDRKMIEKLGDPLIHMIRNSIDHGIESPEVREEFKKNSCGRIRVSGRYEGGNVLIEVSDDGNGIDPEIIAKKAVEKGLYQVNELNEMGSEEVINLIFHPGFSTTDAVTDISGRGVGLDVVKKNIVEDLNGAIDIKTVKERGTTFNIRLPITLALIKVLNINIAEHQFAIPLTYISEIVNIPRANLISVLNKTAFMLHDNVVTIVSLGDILGIRSPAEFRKSLLVLLVKLGPEIVGFRVDSIMGEENTVIKPLPPHMKELHLVSGVKISADNEIINILHIPNILKLARGSRAGELISDEPVMDMAERMHKILIVDDSELALKHERKILESEGYNVDTACNAFEGINMIKDFRYDLVITDIEMPGKDGFTFTHELRRHKGYRQVPVIVSSSLDKEKFRQRAKEVGANGYIVKKNFSASTVSNILKSLPG